MLNAEQRSEAVEMLNRLEHEAVQLSELLNLGTDDEMLEVVEAYRDRYDCLPLEYDIAVVAETVTNCVAMIEDAAEVAKP